MNHSLVTRLTLLVGTILISATVLLAIIVNQATSAEFVDVKREEVATVNPQAEVSAIADMLESAYEQSGVDGLRDMARENDDGSLRTALPFILVDKDLKVLATTEASFSKADIERTAEGGLSFKVLGVEDGEAFDIELVSLSPHVLSTRLDAFIGELVILPGRVDEKSGQVFASRVWKDAAPWLVMVLLLAVLATVWVLRRALRPVDDLTRAAATLKNGGFPEQLDVSGGGSEFNTLIQTFNSATKALADTDTIRRQFISDIAHELRTPVTNIKGQIEALRANLITPDGEFVNTVEAEARLLERLVKDFQEIALSDAGQLRLVLQPIPLRETVENILGPMLHPAQALLENDIPNNLTILADEERIRQILMNLVENSKREKREGLVVKVSGDLRDGQVQLGFEDNGPGIELADRPYIFDRLYRAEKSRNRGTGGAGLGLTIVKGLMTAMGGTISYAQSETGGAVFIMGFCRAETPA
ncbi:sensor histidine kinase [Hyphomonas sp.]|uniref:sensor histidine kinase n=1 Tax=Hyphomonas sp. TaxID=87 RepID=UPI003D2A90EC